MDNWGAVIMEAEDAWRNSVAGTRLSGSNISLERYRIERDWFKAQYILREFGYLYFAEFANRCPHIAEITEYMRVPCERTGAKGQCTVECIFYEGGCTLYAKK